MFFIYEMELYVVFLIYVPMKQPLPHFLLPAHFSSISIPFASPNQVCIVPASFDTM